MDVDAADLDRCLARGARWETWTLQRVAGHRGDWVVTLPTFRAGPEAAAAARAALERRAALQSAAAGPGVAAVLGVATVRDAVGDRPGLIGARVPGRSLTTCWAAFDQGAERPTVAEVAAGVEALARLVGRIHRAGVVHGDVAPGNVLVDGAEVGIVDFGAARSTPGRVTEPVHDGEGGPTQGTPGWVAPEVVAGGAPTEAADAHGVGAIGRAWLAWAIDDDPQRAAVLGAWCDELTRWDPAARPDDLVRAADVLAALAWRADASVPAGPAASVRHAEPTGSGARQRTVEFGPRPPRPPAVATPAAGSAGWGSWPRRVAIVLAVLGCVGVVQVAMGSRGDRRVDAPGSLRLAAPCRAASLPARLSDQPVAADVWGSGCAQQLTWVDQTLQVVPSARSDAERSQTPTATTPSVRRYRIGQPTDQVFVGAWGCESAPTVALYRPGSGEVLTWPRLPDEPGRDAAVRPERRQTGIVDGVARPALDATGCAELVVDADAGRPDPEG